MGLLDIICKEMTERTGVEVKRLHTGSRVLETTAQAKYNDTRRTEPNYTRGVNSARKQTLKK